MNIRKRIFTSMIALAIGSCIAILAFSMYFFIREQNETKYRYRAAIIEKYCKYVGRRYLGRVGTGEGCNVFIYMCS